jgi:cytosine/adenosine deaminase-related metal-dependent hydrolase
MNRRTFLKTSAAFGAAGLLAKAQPARREFLIRDAYVMTMEPGVDDVPGGSVHVRGGEIVAVGKNLKAPGAEVIDGRGMIALPGLIDTHWHMWNTLLRSFAGDQKGEGYFDRRDRYGKVMTADDMYQGTRLAALEAINAGTTTVHNWCHNVRGFSYAEQDIRALRESGLRGRWSYGSFPGQPPTESVNIADLEKLHSNWSAMSGGLLELGLAWRGITNSPAVSRAEFDAARRLGIPISVHISSTQPTIGQIEAHGKAGFLGKDVQLIHAVWATPTEVRMVAEAGATVSVSPGSELRIGYGIVNAGQFLDAGVPLGISVDTVDLTGNANLFGILKLLRNTENARAQNEFKMTARQVLEVGTIMGARSMGMDARIGSLKPGKRADVILVSTRNPTMGVFTDPSHMLIEAAEEADVDTVMVDGRLLKRAGKVTGMSTTQVVADASTALAAIRKRAGDKLEP